MSKSHAIHYRNKYPKGRVTLSEDSVDVFCAGGRHRVALRKNGAGMMVDVSAEMGCEDSHDLAPIPKDARAHKLYSEAGKASRMGKAEEHDERVGYSADLAVDGKILSIDEYKKQGWKFDDSGAAIESPENSK